MKALVVTGPDKGEIREIPYPTLKEDTAIVKIEYTLMCSSDVKLLEGDYHGLIYPHTPGHEFSGVVVDSFHKENIGKRVVVDTLMPCGECEYCKKGFGNLCENLAEIGDNRLGSFAEYVLVKEKNMYEIPEDVSLKDASLIEPLAVALNAINRAHLHGNESITIFGAGVIGLLILNVLKHNNFPLVRVIEQVDFRLEIAKKVGADETYLTDEAHEYELISALSPTDVVFDATGNPNGFNYAIEAVKPAGTISYVSYAGEGKMTFTPSRITLKALNIYGVLSPYMTWEWAVQLFKDHAIKTDLLITHETTLDDYKHVKKMMKNKEDNVIRVAMTLK